MSARFKDRVEAGRELGERLHKFIGHGSVWVLALPRGGVPVAAEVARALDAPLDVLAVRKLGVPGHEEVAMGAIASGGVQVLFSDMIAALRISDAQLQTVLAQQRAELARRERVYRGDRPFPTLAHKIVVLVDDGLATGATMAAAARALQQLNPERVIAAVPVAPRDVQPSLLAAVDELIAVYQPEHFQGVGQFYRDFGQTTDAEVQALLEPYYTAPKA